MSAPHAFAAPPFEGNRQIPLLATVQKIGHDREITWTLCAKEAPEHIPEDWLSTCWIVEVVAKVTRDRKPFSAKHLFSH